MAEAKYKNEKKSDSEDDVITPEYQRDISSDNDSDGITEDDDGDQSANTDNHEGVVPPDYFVDGPVKPEQPGESAGYTSAYNANVKEEGVIPPDFFSDSSPSKSEIKSETTLDEDAELERKYAERLREWQALVSLDENMGDNKPHCSRRSNDTDQSTCGSQRKSRRSRSRSPRRRHKKDRKSSSDRKYRYSSSRKRSKRDRRSRSKSLDIKPLRVHPDLLSTNFKPIKLERLMAAPQKASTDRTPAECETVEMKQQRGIERAKAQLLAFENHRKSAGTFSKFIYTNTVCQIPKKDSLLGNTIGENRSPLSTNHNVEYALTSMGGRVDLAQYGLQQPTQPVVDLLKIVGMDVNRLEALRAKSKMPPKLLKLKNEENGNNVDVGGVPKSVFSRDAQTQTDVRLLEPVGHSIGTQYTGSETLIDMNLLNDQGRFAYFMFQQLMNSVPRSHTEEMQQNSRLIEAIKLARSAGGGGWKF